MRSNPLGAGLEVPGYFEFSIIHETVHVLGLVPICATHHYPPNPAHVNDHANDLMWALDTQSGFVAMLTRVGPQP